MKRKREKVRMVRLHPQVYPKTYHSLLTIEQDGGGINRIDTPYGFHVTIPVYWVPGLSIIENALHGLSEEDFETMCTGEHDDMNEIASRSAGLRLAHKFMDDYFDDRWNSEKWEVEAEIAKAKAAPHD